MSFIRQQCDEEVWNEVAKNMRPRPTIRKLVDIMSVIKCGNQVDGDNLSERRDAVFEDYKDDVLSGKLWKNPRIRCENGEAKIEIIDYLNLGLDPRLKGAQKTSILSARYQSRCPAKDY